MSAKRLWGHLSDDRLNGFLGDCRQDNDSRLGEVAGLRHGALDFLSQPGRVVEGDRLPTGGPLDRHLDPALALGHVPVVDIHRVRVDDLRCRLRVETVVSRVELARGERLEDLLRLKSSRGGQFGDCFRCESGQVESCRQRVLLDGSFGEVVYVCIIARQVG